MYESMTTRLNLDRGDIQTDILVVKPTEEIIQKTFMQISEQV